MLKKAVLLIIFLIGFNFISLKPARAINEDNQPPYAPKVSANYNSRENKVEFNWRWQGDRGGQNKVGYCTGKNKTNRNFSCDNKKNPPFWWQTVEDGQKTYLHKSYDNRAGNKSFKWNSSNTTSYSESCQGRAGHVLRIDIRSRDGRGNISRVVSAQATCPGNTPTPTPVPTATPTPTSTPITTPLPDLTLTKALICYDNNTNTLKGFVQAKNVGTASSKQSLIGFEDYKGYDYQCSLSQQWTLPILQPGELSQVYSFSQNYADQNQLYSLLSQTYVNGIVDDPVPSLCNGQAESDKNNNTSSPTVIPWDVNRCGPLPTTAPTPTSLPDLTSKMTACILEKNESKLSLKLTYSVYNHSQTNISNSFETLSSYHISLLGKTPIFSDYYNGLKANGVITKTRQVSFLSPNYDSWNGKISLNVNPDYGNDIPESNENNNDYNTNITPSWCPGYQPAPNHKTYLPIVMPSFKSDQTIIAPVIKYVNSAITNIKAVRRHFSDLETFQSQPKSGSVFIF